MKYYFLNNKNNNLLLGFTTDEKLLNKFMKQRGKDYTVTTIKEKDLNSDLIKKLNSSTDKLIRYTENGKELIIFEYEENGLPDNIFCFITELNTSVWKFAKLLTYIKFEPEEREIVFDGLDIIERMGQDVEDEECSVEYEQYFNTIKILKHNLGID